MTTPRLCNGSPAKPPRVGRLLAFVPEPRLLATPAFSAASVVRPTGITSMICASTNPRSTMWLTGGLSLTVA